MTMTPEERAARAAERKRLREEQAREDAERPAKLALAVQAYFTLKAELESSDAYIWFHEARRTVERLLEESHVSVLGQSSADEVWYTLSPLQKGGAEIRMGGIMHGMGHNEGDMPYPTIRVRITEEGLIDRTWEQTLRARAEEEEEKRRKAEARKRKAEAKKAAEARERATYEKLRAKFEKESINA